jgi:hypothetical protein
MLKEKTMFGVSVQNQCEHCGRGAEPFLLPTLRRLRFRPVHPIPNTRGEYVACKNFDSECRHLAEGMGFYRVAWWPVKCRNGKWRWLSWIEDHGDGSYSLGNRAH